MVAYFKGIYFSVSLQNTNINNIYVELTVSGNLGFWDYLQILTPHNLGLFMNLDQQD